MNMHAPKTVVTSLFVAIAWPLFCLDAIGWQSETPVEYVVEAPRPQRGLGTVSYRPSDAEMPVFQELGRTEKKSGGLGADYDIRNHDAQYVGWFGIVRNITVDIERHETRLLIEHKYFDGFTDAHLQALSFNGSGDFEAILCGEEHQIEELQLVKVYGTVTYKKADELPSIKVDFARDWAWGTFTFILAYGTQRGSDEWRKLNTRPLDEIYSSRPDDNYYIARLGPNKAMGIRTELDSDAHVRYCVAGAIEMFGHDAREAALELARVLKKDVDINVRWNTAGALGATGDSLIAVPALVRALADSSPAVNRFAAMGLKKLGKDATDAIPKLKEQLNAKDEGARIAAAEAIFHIGGNVDDCLPILQSILQQGEFPTAMWAANALVAFGPKAKPALKSLVQATRNGQIYPNQQPLSTTMACDTVNSEIRVIGWSQCSHRFAPTSEIVRIPTPARRLAHTRLI